MAGITERLAEFVAGLGYAALPAEVVGRAKLLVLDTAGICLRARHDAESTPALLAAVADLGLDRGEATVLGDAAGYAPAAAALINGALAHSLDFDDTHAEGSIHASAPVVPAALAAAEMTGASGREAIAAIVAGYEVHIRLSLALEPKAHYERGFHPSATCGAFGAAAAAARVFGLDAARVADAFGIALSQAAGSMRFAADGAWTKRFQVGHAAQCGLTAASLARAGFKGGREAIEGTAGFLHAYAPAPKPERAVEGLGERYETLAIGVKPYPSCRYGHAALDALIALRAEHALRAEEIEAVEIGLPEAGFRIIGAPEARKQRPESVVDGQFSMPFVAAVALRDGGLAWDAYARHLADPETRALCRRVRSVIDARAEAEFPRRMSAAVRVRARGREFEAFVAVPKGEPERFPPVATLRAKFADLARPALPAERIEAFADALMALEGADAIGPVLRLARPEGRAARAAAE